MEGGEGNRTNGGEDLVDEVQMKKGPRLES